MTANATLHAEKGKRRTGGFSLLELLVSLVLMASLVALLSAGLYISIRWEQNSLNRNSVSFMAELASQQTIKQILQRTLPLTLAQRGEGRKVVFDGRAREISLVAFAPLQSLANRLYAVRLKMVSSNDRFETVRVTATEIDNRLNRLDGGHTHQSDLAIGRAPLAFSFFGSPDGHLEASWHSNWSQQSALPEMVRISLNGRMVGDHDAQIPRHFRLPLDWAPVIYLERQK